MKSTVLAAMACMAALTACATTRQSEIDSATEQAIKLCGVGTSEKTLDAYRAALNAASKQPSIGFEHEAVNEVNTQMGILLQQGSRNSDPSFKLAVDEMQKTQECVIQEFEKLRPQTAPTRPELLDACRQDIQNKLSPPLVNGNGITYGTLRGWNQVDQKLDDSQDIVTMAGFFDTGGDTGGPVEAECDLRGGRFNGSVMIEPKHN